MITRKEEILKLIEGNDSNSVRIVRELVDDFVFLEEQLKELRKLPQIVVNKANPSLQKTTPAAKLYKDTLIQYSNLIKIILSACEEEATEDDENVISQLFKKKEEFFQKCVQK